MATATLASLAAPAGSLAASTGDSWLRIAVRPADIATQQRTTTTAGPKPSSFRHTFGAERTTTDARRAAAAATAEGAASVDIVFAHDIADASVLRRQLPAQHWSVVVSRHLASGMEQRPARVTGLGVRHGATLRIVRQEHFAPAMQGRATALLLKTAESQVWLLSVDLEPGAEGALIARWVDERRADGTAVIVAGRGLERLALAAAGTDRAPDAGSTPRTPPPLENRMDVPRNRIGPAADFTTRTDSHCGDQGPEVLFVSAGGALEAGRGWLAPLRAGTDAAPPKSLGCLLVIDIAVRGR